MNVFRFFSALLLFLASAISAQAAADTFEHPNGLRMTVPHGVAVTQTANGFVVGENPPGVQRGGGLNAVVEVVTSVSWLEGKRTREAAPGKIFAYEFTRIPGEGSGGDEYILNACIKQKERAICFKQSKLSEYGEPQFEAWTLAGGLSLK
jgi:hypothetical protein